MIVVSRVEKTGIAYSYPPSTPSPEWFPELSENCAVCGDRVHSVRLGSPACLGCIVFFRRAIINVSKYKCLKDGDCLINYEFRSSCRACRLQKCLQVGMKQSAVKRRDCLGPRKVTPPTAASTPPVVQRKPESYIIQNLVKIQDRHFEEHRDQSVSEFRRATVSDVNKVLKWSINNAIEWASQFSPFQLIMNEDQKCVISEYGFAFLVVDQAFRTISETPNGCWYLQNGTYLNSDYLYGLTDEAAKFSNSSIRKHSEFVKSLEKTIKIPFEIMDIDTFEIAALKSLLLVSPSFPKWTIFADYQEKMVSLKNKCLNELMEYLQLNYPDTFMERYGQLILLLGNIRCAVKLVYNQTKVSDLFNAYKFDLYVRSFILT
ncbi:Nuclear Hormone Receptor family [Caenorhabditis elegans]|uniref:Nuclear Hormone Receptor family n=1 Tax=Caenorhabditis elegans TaxID=6239 RepID=P90822_CAEEL|nr:Nuclear Hormone Receptor family [Caenorhabditis elegans]CAB02906.2 Nuclear Hormone Receptor family [Caenorhabditis elegans]|eukprot:NP_506438.2 Nuclear Hormone Receptor family [Caenorhabditis elegans]